MLETLDQASLSNLLEMVGEDPDFMDELVDAYLADTPEQIAALRAAAAGADTEGLVRPAHTLKGSSANLGAMRVAAAARSIEERARVGELGEVPALLDELDVAYGELVTELGRARARRWSGG